MKDYRTFRPRLFAAALVLIAVVALFIGMALRARWLSLTALDGRRERLQEQTRTTEFTLRAEMRREQAMVRVGGWLSVVHPELVELTTQRGTLQATVCPSIAGEAGSPWVIALHGGLGTSSSQVQDVACELSLAGYNVLLPDLYAHGQSDGVISTLGVRDAQDVRAWIDWLLARDPGARIALFGQDEGALAILLAAGEGLPDAIACAALDSVYLDVRARMARLLQETGAGGTLDEWLLRAAMRMVCGADVGGVDARGAVKNAAIPLLFIHGTLDSDVSATHSEEAARTAANGRLLFVEGAAHGMARYIDPEAYYGELIALFDTALGEKRQ